MTILASKTSRLAEWTFSRQIANTECILFLEDDQTSTSNWNEIPVIGGRQGLGFFGIVVLALSLINRYYR